jgi:UDPglucose 6-dehydrogenase
MRICVVGTGYVGLVAGACLSDTGQFVTCVDVDEAKVEQLSRGEPTIYEPGLGELLRRNIDAGRLQFTTSLSEGISECGMVFVAVGTPPLPDGSVDLSQVTGVVEQIAREAREHKILIMKSTVPVGTYRRVMDLLETRAQVGIDYVSNPEFLKEGNAIADFTKPDRVIIGSYNPQAAKSVAHLYGPYMRQSDRVILTDPATAELAKYAANTMLAMRISFMNELSRLCDKVGANVEDIRRGVGTDKRIGPAFLFAGLGYGGFCFPKDVQALASIGREHELSMPLAEATHLSNTLQITHFTRSIAEHFRGDLAGRTLAAWGLAYKARTDDVRLSPAVAVCRWLAEQGANVVAHDPQALRKARAELGDSVRYCDDMYTALDGADALVCLTDWQEFRGPDFDMVAKRLASAVIFDGRNLYDPHEMRSMGFTYVSVGRPCGDAARVASS